MFNFISLSFLLRSPLSGLMQSSINTQVVSAIPLRQKSDLVAKVGLMHDPTMSRDLRDNWRGLTKNLMASHNSISGLRIV